MKSLFKVILPFSLMVGILLAARMAVIVKANNTPVVNTVIITTSTPQGGAASAVDLTEAASTTVYARGSMSDADGTADIDLNSLVLVFYRSGVTSTADCVADNVNCYRVTGGCTVSTTSATDLDYECSVGVGYYADATDSGAYAAQDWRAKIWSVDMSSASSSLESSTELNSLTALTVDATLNYGSLSLGETMATDTAVIVTNRGNTTVDVQLSGTALTCTNGAMSVGQEHYAVNSGVAYGSMVALTATATLTQLNLAPQSSGSLSTSSLYFKLAAPTVGAGGSCDGSITVTAVPD